MKDALYYTSHGFACLYNDNKQREYFPQLGVIYKQILLKPDTKNRTQPQYTISGNIEFCILYEFYSLILLKTQTAVHRHTIASIRQLTSVCLCTANNYTMYITEVLQRPHRLVDPE